MMGSTLPHASPRETLSESSPQDMPPANLVRELMARQVLLEEDWEHFLADAANEFDQCQDTAALLALLLRHRLLTEYQVRQIAQGNCSRLVLGGYRLCDRLGTGGMGTVYLAEHIALRRQVALKVVRFAADENPHVLKRFLIETRTVAQLNHPGIVTVFDAGQVRESGPGFGDLYYLAMEHLQGSNLDDLVSREGRLLATRACDLISQVAAALDEAHRFHLVHRDIKPANIFVVAGQRIKLLDFGVARNFRTRMTEHGTLLGTVDFMAPEQAQDASGVDIRADVYSLGGTLFWCLTGQRPFEKEDSILQTLARRATLPPPSLRRVCPDLPAELDAVVQRMMAANPADRYQDPRAVLQALFPFCQLAGARCPHPVVGFLESQPTSPRHHRVLIVDDEPAQVHFSSEILRGEDIDCCEASSGLEALQFLQQGPFDLVLLDMQMPEMPGEEVLRCLRQAPPSPHLKVILTSGAITLDQMARLMLTGADDFLPKPFSLVQFKARVQAALRLKDAQDQADQLRRHLLTVNNTLEKDLLARDSDLVLARNVLVLAMAKLVERRDFETGKHLLRMQRYCRILAEEAAALPCFHDQIDPLFVQTLECCVPLHDIGKVGVPDQILLKPGALTNEERSIMQAHTTMGAETLREVARQHPYAPAFMQMAIDVTRHHHERWDGNGYPDRLAGDGIPLAARLTTLADVYDALRSRRVYKPALSHEVTVRTMSEGSGQFDPALLAVFQRCSHRLGEVYDQLVG
jgi:response regulator RpfG family c-di-GMP phosphodiesterase